jgi:glycosyltransferase involved in cell wall biosynthesis
MSVPKISVVTVSLNQAAYIEANIRSVLAQQYPGVEHIVVDGGSTDGTLDILKRHPHLRWISEPDSGQSNALNKGFAMATGEIVGWLNSDDTYEPGAFAAVAEKFADPAVKVVYGDGHEIDANGAITKAYVSRDVSFDGLVRYWRWRYEFVQPAFFFRRSVFAGVAMLDEALHYAMDFDLFIRLAAKYEFAYVPKPLANLRLHGESKTGKNYRKIVPAYIKEMQRVSYRNWGSPAGAGWLSYAASFAGAVLWSVVKNLLFLPGSKSRQRLSGGG